VREIKEVIKQVAGVRRTGAAALDLAWVAAGRFDAYWERGIKPWDMAAGIVLVREAGGSVTDVSGGSAMFDKSEVLATNSALQKEFLPLLAGA
jgi:myo-inositol-1(or 4)-monophosphatase